MKRSWPILWRWLGQAVLFSVPVGLLLAWTVSERRDEALREAEGIAAILAQNYAREVDLLLADSGDLLDALQRLPALQSMFELGCPEGPADGLPESVRRYGNLLLVGATGQLVCAAVTGGSGGENFADRTWFRATVEGDGLHVSEPIRGRLTDRQIVVLSIPVAAPDGTAPRVLALTLDLMRLSASLERSYLPADTVVSLVDDQARVLARSLDAAAWIGQRVDLPGYRTNVSPGEVEDHAGLDGTNRLFAAAGIEQAPWTVFVGLPIQAVNQGMRADLQRTTLVVGAAAFLLLVLATWMSASVGGPVRRLAALLREIRRDGGHLDGRVRGPREIEEMALEFDRLLDSRAETLRDVERSERRYRATFEQAPVGIVHQDVAGRYVRVNQRFAEMLGREVEALLGAHDHEFTHPQDRVSSGAIYRRLQAGDLAVGQLQKRYLRADGVEVWVDITVSRVGEAGEAPLFISVVEDVTLAREEQARRMLAATVFESSTEGIVIADSQRRIRAVNKAFTELTGLDETSMLSRSVESLRSDLHPEEFYDELWQAVAEQDRWRGEVWLPRVDADPFPTMLSVSAVRDEHGRVTNYVAVFTDISREKQSEAELDYLVHHDALTQLPNRRLFNARLDHTIQQAYRDPERHFSLLFIDLDDFKVVNDSLGHDAGDQLLVEFASRLRDAVRGEDTVARMGGDEFMVLLEGAGTFNEVNAVINKVLRAAQAPFQISGRDVFVSASVGVAIFPLDAAEGPELVRNADVAMYRAKDRGKNRFEFYEASMSEQAMERLSLANDMRRALESGQFYLEYQPKVLAVDGRLAGFEALLRWHHPERGKVSAERFIRIAEDTGLIVPIGQWVLREALAQIAAWRRRGLDSVSMAVNLSAQEIAHPRLLDAITEAIAAAGVPGEALELELTESALIRDPSNVVPLLRSLRKLGVRVAIDDFGTGYSSLNYLRQFRVDVLKIDRSFVVELETSERARILPQAVVALGRALKLSTVAEGVETAAQADILRAMGCEQLQGYGIARPMPAEEAGRYLESLGLIRAAGAD